MRLMQVATAASIACVVGRNFNALIATKLIQVCQPDVGISEIVTQIQSKFSMSFNQHLNNVHV
ncbi:hypothetical protein YQE_00504, partial [Dendroctonus ponderosae]